MMPRIVCVLVATLSLGGCATRGLSPNEDAFARSIMGDAVTMEDVTIVRGSASALLTAEVPPRPRETCRERLYPPRDVTVSGRFPAFVLGETMHFSRAVYSADFLAGYPDRMALEEAMRLAHELTHVWQWQNRALTGYSPLAAMSEHVTTDDPYLVDIDPDRAFLDYGWEQQGILVEEFVCCRALDPDGQRTVLLTRVLGEVFPAIGKTPAVPRENLHLPWDGARTEGICD